MVGHGILLAQAEVLELRVQARGVDTGLRGGIPGLQRVGGLFADQGEVAGRDIATARLGIGLDRSLHFPRQLGRQFQGRLRVDLRHQLERVHARLDPLQPLPGQLADLFLARAHLDFEGLVSRLGGLR